MLLQLSRVTKKVPVIERQWKQSLHYLLRLQCTHIGALLSRQHAVEMERNWRMFLKVLACIKFLPWQGLPLHGHDDDSDSNLIQLLKHHGEEDKELLDSYFLFLSYFPSYHFLFHCWEFGTFYVRGKHTGVAFNCHTHWGCGLCGLTNAY